GAALAAARRQKAAHVEFVSRQAARGKRSDGGGGAGNRDHWNAVLDGKAHDAVAGIGDGRRSGVADQGNGGPPGEPLHQFGGALALVVLVVAERGSRDAVVVEQAASVARIFAGDHLGGAQHTQRPQRDVFQGADGSGDDVETGGKSFAIAAFGPTSGFHSRKSISRSGVTGAP